MTTLSRLEKWYRAQCDGDWEHSYGIRLETLDNPGWRCTIDLVGTPLEGVPFAQVRDLDPGLDWMVCEVKDGGFQIACGPARIEEALVIFLDWAEQQNGAPAGS